MSVLLWGDPHQFFTWVKNNNHTLAGFSHAGLTALFLIVFTRWHQLHKNGWSRWDASQRLEQDIV